MSTTPPLVAARNQAARRHRELIKVGFAIQLDDVELFPNREGNQIDVYTAQLLHCDRNPNTPRPTMPFCLRPWADEAQW